MTGFVLRRLLGAVPTLLVLATLAFFLMRAAPGGPFDAERALPPQVRAQIEAAYDLDRPLHEQYLRWLGGLVRGDLGPSFQYPGRTVNELIAEGLPASLLLGGLALALALPVGIGLGICAAVHRNRLADHATMLLAMAGLALPAFVVAPVLILIFALQLELLPAGGWTEQGARALVLPVIALALPQIAYIARLTRGSMIETLHAPFIRTARAKGLSGVRLLLVHALPPTLVPVLSWLGPAAAGVITGSVVVEQIFGIPGLGRHFVQGALNRDYTLVMGVVVFYGALIVLFNLLVDLAYGLLDPRVRKRR